MKRYLWCLYIYIRMYMIYVIYIYIYVRTYIKLAYNISHFTYIILVLDDMMCIYII